MTWALKRQIIFLIGFLSVIAGLLFWISYPILNKPPTCMDNRQNGNETGVDCGGSCALACLAELDEVSILWSRAFRVVPGRYNAVAYIENKNANVSVRKIRYQFRFADKDNIYIGKREGETIIPPSGKFAVFEPAIDVGNSVPVFTSFEFTEVPVWSQVSSDKINQLKVLTQNIRLEGEDTSPKLFATLRNNSLYAIPKLSVVVILYDKDGNAINASRTYIEELKKEGTADISFTWPEPFDRKIIVREIIPMFDVFEAKLK